MDSIMESGQIPITKTIKSADHSDYMLKRLEKFYVNEEFCDVTLIAASDNTQVKAHRGALAVASEFFLKVFSNELKPKEIELQHIDGVVLRLMINFIYTASIELSHELVEQIAKAAHLYQIDSLADACFDFMGKELTVDKCISYYVMAKKYGWKKLQKKAINVISENFSIVTNAMEFLGLEKDQLCKLIDSDELNVQSEEEVFHSIAKWLNYDELSRKKSMRRLLKSVRFSDLSSKFISDNSHLVCKTVECNNLLWKWMTWHLSPEKRSEIEGLNTKSRKSRHMKTLIALNRDGSILYTFDCNSYSWSEKQLPKSEPNLFIYRNASTIAYNKLNLIGGVHCNKAISSVLCLDLKTWELTNLPPIIRKRYNHSSVFVNGALYVLGGRDGNHLVDCIEKYDFSNRTWQVIGNIPFSGNIQAAVINNEIYIIESQNMYSYDTTTRLMLPMPSKKHNTNNFVLCAVNGYLYAVGYSDHKIIECYNPTMQSWFTIKSSPVKNNKIKCISYNNRLCVLGFKNDVMISAEEYYPETDEWMISAIVPLKKEIHMISEFEHE